MSCANETSASDYETETDSCDDAEDDGVSGHISEASSSTTEKLQKKEIARMIKNLKCPLLIGTCLLNGELLREKFFYQGIKKKHTVDDINDLVTGLTSSLNSKCPIQYNDIRSTKNFLIMRCYCDFKFCKSFLLKIPHDQLEDDRVEP